MRIIDTKELGAQANRMLRFVEMYNQLRAEAQALHPGYDLIIAKMDDGQPDLMPVESSTKPDPEFLKLGGVSKIVKVLENGPMQRGKILEEIRRRGKKMTSDFFGTYFRRAQGRRLIREIGGGNWVLADSNITYP